MTCPVASYQNLWDQISDDVNPNLTCDFIAGDPDAAPSQAPLANAIYVNGDKASPKDILWNPKWRENYVAYDWHMIVTEGWELKDGKLAQKEGGVLTLIVKIAKLNNAHLSGLGSGYYTLFDADGDTLSSNEKKLSDWDTRSTLSLFGNHDPASQESNKFENKKLLVEVQDTDAGRVLTLKDVENEVSLTLNLKETPAHHGDCFVYEEEITRCRFLRPLQIGDSSHLQVKGSEIDFSKISPENITVKSDRGFGALSVEEPMHSWNWIQANGTMTSPTGQERKLELNVEGIRSFDTLPIETRQQPGNVIISLDGGEAQRFNGLVTFSKKEQNGDPVIVMSFGGQNAQGKGVLITDVVIPWRKPVDMSQKIPLLLDLDFKASQSSFSSGNIRIDSEDYSLKGVRAYVENGVYESLSNESVYTPSTSIWERIKSRVSAWFP